jgi:hypothetical protein
MLLDEMRALHDRKSHDYAEDGNPYSNFEFAAQLAEGFTGVDAVFAVLMGIKLARLRELTAKGKTPNNESIEDTRRDAPALSLEKAGRDKGGGFDPYNQRGSGKRVGEAATRQGITGAKDRDRGSVLDQLTGKKK